MSKSNKQDIEYIDLSDLIKDPLKNDKIPWKCIFYKAWFSFARLFKNPYGKKKHELNLLEQVEILINTGEPGFAIEACRSYIILHRIVENTRARRRLERWVTRLIEIYLICVFGFMLSNYFFKFNADNTVIVTLLSTTTVNIVALGIILVKGLFHEAESKDVSKEYPISTDQEKKQV